MKRKRPKLTYELIDHPESDFEMARFKFWDERKRSYLPDKHVAVLINWSKKPNVQNDIRISYIDTPLNRELGLRVGDFIRVMCQIGWSRSLAISVAKRFWDATEEQEQ